MEQECSSVCYNESNRTNVFLILMRKYHYVRSALFVTV